MLGAPGIATMHRGDRQPRVGAIVGRYALVGAILIAMAVIGWDRLTGIAGNVSVTWIVVFGILCIALIEMMLVDLRRWRRRDDAPDEWVGSTEIAWLLGCSGLVVTAAGKAGSGLSVETLEPLRRLGQQPDADPSQIESLVVQPLARTRLRKPPPDVAVVSIFRKRTRLTSWIGRMSTPSDSVVIHLHGCPADEVADRLMQALEPLKGQPDEASPAGQPTPDQAKEGVLLASAGSACPRCAAPARLPANDALLHPAWCTLHSPWTCERCRATIPAGSVVARGQSDGDVRGPGPINVLLEVVYLCLQIIAAFVLVVAMIFIMLFSDFDWGALVGGAAMGAASVALLLWFGFRGPIWRLPLLKASPCRARHVCDLAVCVAPGTVEVRRARGFRNARWRRFAWARPAGLHVAHHPEGPLLISPFENSFRLWAFLPSDPRGYRAAELAEALRRAYGDGAERSA